MTFKARTYVDYQATTPVAAEVMAKMLPFFTESFGNPHSSDHSYGWEAAAAVEKAASQVAGLIGSDPDEVVFTSGATESNNLALLGIARRARMKGASRNRILLSSVEHKSVLAVGRVLQEQYGFHVELLPVDEQGFVQPSELERRLGKDVLMVSVMAVNNEIGTIQNIEAISSLTKGNGALFHCDAAQGPLAIEMKALSESADLISLSAHKMYGPKGIGALFIRREVQGLVEPMVYGGGQQNGLRSGTVPTPLCVGMGAAAEYVQSDQARGKLRHLRDLRDSFLTSLRGLSSEIRFYGPNSERRHPGNVSVGFPDRGAQDLLGAMQPAIAASTGSACTSGTPEPSHVLTAIGLSSDEASNVLRFSLGLDTTEQDLEAVLARVRLEIADTAFGGL